MAVGAGAEGWSTVVLPPASLVSVSLGPLIIGAMVEHLLLGMICYQATTYFRYHFSDDGRFIRSIVTSLVGLSIIIGIINSMSIYQSTVVGFGDFDKFDCQNWVSWVEPGVTALVALIAHTFYICRCWAVTRSLPTIVSLVLGLYWISWIVVQSPIVSLIVALLAFASGITVSVYCFILGRLSKIAGAMTPGYVWFLSTSICDITIATVLTAYFWHSDSNVPGINIMLSRLRRTSIESGALTAICALLNLILFAAFAPAGYYFVLQCSMSHLYTLPVLYTLLSRQDLRQMFSTRSGTTGLEQSSYLFTSVFNYSIFGKTTMEQDAQIISAEGSRTHCYDLAWDENNIAMRHIHHNSNLNDIPFDLGQETKHRLPTLADIED